ncbi:MAG: hypothetical protein FIB07_04725 [Candidatus Methanoperedens sp.]|nr:hypothetical protein [Candidatus Methanoperedens sp.]
MKLKNGIIVVIFALLILLIPAMPATQAAKIDHYKQGIGCAFTDKVYIQGCINDSKKQGADAIIYGLDARSIDQIRNYGGTDYLKIAIDRSHELGMKFIFVFDPKKYASDAKSKNLFETEPQAKIAFMSDLEWMLITYPELDGIQIEEPNGQDSPTRLAFNNKWFTEMYQLVRQYKVTQSSYDNFYFGFNYPSNSYSGISTGGLDVSYINGKNPLNVPLFNAFEFQLPTSDQTLSDSEAKTMYENLLNTWKSRFTNIDVGAWIYVSSSGLINKPTCIKLPAGGYGSPDCYNQQFFSELSYAKQKSYKAIIFREGLLASGNNVTLLWPDSGNYPGSTAEEKVINIWRGSVPAITPESTSTLILTPAYTYAAPAVAATALILIGYKYGIFKKKRK